MDSYSNLSFDVIAWLYWSALLYLSFLYTEWLLPITVYILVLLIFLQTKRFIGFIYGLFFYFSTTQRWIWKVALQWKYLCLNPYMYLWLFMWWCSLSYFILCNVDYWDYCFDKLCTVQNSKNKLIQKSCEMDASYFHYCG